MKKIFAVLLVLALSSASFAAEIRVIPYPDGLDTMTEGASSAPANINHNFSIYFDTLTDFFELKPSKNRVILSKYPTYQQTLENTCGPAAALTVLYYFGVKDYDEMSLAVEMKTQRIIGTNPGDMLEFFKKIGWKTQSNLSREPFENYSDFQDFIIENLSQNLPVIVENVDWGGHWRVIIGYDTMGTENTLDDVLILADPYDTCDHKQDGYVVENGEKFFSMWFDHSMLPEDQRKQPFIIASPR